MATRGVVESDDDDDNDDMARVILDVGTSRSNARALFFVLEKWSILSFE
jgi:hypothetical protein